MVPERERADAGRAERSARQGLLLLVCGVLLYGAAHLVDRVHAARPDAAGLRDVIHFAGVGLGLLLVLAAGLMLWRSIRPPSG